MKKNFERVIVTNNPATAKSYGKTDKVMFMENATPNEVYTEAKKLIESGGRLIKPMLKDTTDYYSTVGIFFDEDKEPTPWNLREIEAACRATEGQSQFRGKGRKDQLVEMWKNAPEHRKVA
jgi:hypothetical protein